MFTSACVVASMVFQILQGSETKMYLRDNPITSNL